MKKINYETLMPIIVLGVALLIGLIIGINATNVTDNNTTTVTTEVTIELATPIDMASPTDLLENMDANEEDISTEQHIEPESLYETTTEEVTTTEYYIEPTTETQTTEVQTTEAPEGMTYLGTYSLTAYCACVNCCGKTDAITASGTVATAGRTVACNSLPFGTVISINGNQYVVEDRGGMSDYVIDIFFDNHEEAINFGRQSADVYIVN